MGNCTHQKSSKPNETKPKKKVVSIKYRVTKIIEENEDLKRKIESF